MQNKRLEASWVGRQGGAYRAEVYQEGYAGLATDASVPYERPAELEWADGDKLAAVTGASLTLRVISETDREFYDLYTVKAGDVTVKLYRDGELYWWGSLDPEQYEEPYATERGYEVELTFTDFGLLDRVKWEGTGLASMGGILAKVLQPLQGTESMATQVRCTTTSEAGAAWATLKVDAMNFYDEDGEAMTLREVAEAILKPFGLRMQQKGGAVWVYDLNWAYEHMATEEAWWSSTNQRLGADRVYNNVRVRLSQYADKTIIDGTVDHDILEDSYRFLIYCEDTGAHDPDVAEGFYLRHGQAEVAAVELSNGAEFFRIDPEYSGSEEAGIALGVTIGNPEMPSSRLVEAGGYSEVVRVTGGWQSGRGGKGLRISAELLYDVRYNPYEKAGSLNEEGNYERFQDQVRRVYLPAQLVVVDDEGNVVAHYSNVDVAFGDRRYGKGRWIVGGYDDPWTFGSPAGWDYILCWRGDTDEDNDSCPLNGWTGNKTCVNRQFTGYLPSRYAKMENDLVAWPPVAGRLELRLCNSLEVYDGDCTQLAGYGASGTPNFAPVRWVMLKDIKAEVVKTNGTDLDAEDIEDMAWLNRDAQEGLDIDTQVGTVGTHGLPTAKAAVRDGQGIPVYQCTRAGVTDRLERLLIGTAYSQYAERKKVLTGEARLLPGLTLVTDAATEGKFLVLSEVQDLGEETSEIKASELSAEEYEGIEYETV